MQQGISIVFGLALMGFSCVASARIAANNMILVEGGYYYASSSAKTTYESNPDQESPKATASTMNFKIGKVFQKGWYLGAIYSGSTNGFASQSSDSASAMGVSGGYVGNSGFFVHGHYLFQASTPDYSGGSGTQADLGYKMELTSKTMIGAQICVRSLTYTKSKMLMTMKAHTENDTFPMATFSVMF